MFGVVKDIPVPIDEPPVAVAYHFKVPALAVAPNERIPASQRADDMILDTVGVIFTVARTGVLDGLLQPLFVAST